MARQPTFPLWHVQVNALYEAHDLVGAVEKCRRELLNYTPEANGPVQMVRGHLYIDHWDKPTNEFNSGE